MNASCACVCVCAYVKLNFSALPTILIASPSVLLLELTLTSTEEFFHSVLSCICSVIHALFFNLITQQELHENENVEQKIEIEKNSMFSDNKFKGNGSSQLRL